MTPVVLLHGWAMNASVFDGLCGHLAARHAVHAFDLPGHGGAPFEPACALEELAARFASRAPAKCHVLGWSLGAQLALAWARSKPRQIERLALVAATPCFVRRADWACAMDSAVFESFAAALACDCAAALTRFISLQAQGDDDERRVRRELQSVLVARPAPAAAALEQGLRLLRESDQRKALDGIAARTLIVHGERDQLVPVDAARSLARALPHSRLEVVAGAAHAPFVSAPERAGRLLAEFFDE